VLSKDVPLSTIAATNTEVNHMQKLTGRGYLKVPPEQKLKVGWQAAKHEVMSTTQLPFYRV